MEYKGYNFEYFSGTMTENEFVEMVDILEDFKPKRICELGSGQSTVLFENYCNKSGCELFSIEHNYKYKRKNTIMMKLIDNETNITINGRQYNSCNKYVGFENWLEKQDKFDFILIDGPFGYGKRLNYKYNRIQILSFAILDKIQDEAFVLYHDSERPNAKTTLEEFENIIKEKGFSFEKRTINDLPELTIYKLSKKTK